MSDKVSFAVEGDVARIAIERPDVHNAFDEDVIDALRSAFERAAGESAVRAVVLAGRGKSFSAGADLDWMKRAASYDEAKNEADARALGRMLRAVERCPKLTIARVHGAALGGGCGLVAACDVAIAAKRAVFGFSEVKLGIIPAVISPFVVARIGVARARELFTLGERFDAARALEVGLVARVVEDDQALDAAIDETVAKLRTSAPGAVAAAKELVATMASLVHDKTAADFQAAKLLAKRRATDEAKEGIAAFLEKRSPKWAPPPIIKEKKT